MKKIGYGYIVEKTKDFLNPGHPVFEGLADLFNTGDLTLGAPVKEFEKRFAELVGAKYAIGVANGTDALRISLRVVGVRPGDEVLTAANTFVASAGCVDELFAIPRFIDMAPFYTLDSDLLEKAITPKTKAIVPVHFTGEPCEMDKLMEVADKHGIPVVEDACQAVLAKYKGKCVGNFGKTGCFSLHPLKNLNVVGDGGMIITNDDVLFDKICRYRNHNLINRDSIGPEGPGCNSRLDSVQAVVGNYMIRETVNTVAKRRENAFYYDSSLRGIRGISLAVRRPHVEQTFHLYMIEVDKRIRDQLVDFLNRSGIDTRVHYPRPLQGILEFYGFGRSDFPKAYEQADRVVSLRVDEHITRDEQNYIITKIADFMGRNHA